MFLTFPLVGDEQLLLGSDIRTGSFGRSGGIRRMLLLLLLLLLVLLLLLLLLNKIGAELAPIHFSYGRMSVGGLGTENGSRKPKWMRQSGSGHVHGLVHGWKRSLGVAGSVSGSVSGSMSDRRVSGSGGNRRRKQRSGSLSDGRLGFTDSGGLASGGWRTGGPAGSCGSSG